MSVQYGCLEEFRPDTDSIKAYLERASLYFQANDIDERKQVPILLSLIGASNYALLRDLVAPDVPGTLSFARIVEVLSSHFEPKRSVIAERFHFHRRMQATGESIAEFDAALRKLATHCEFGNTLEETLRDRFVCGLQHEAIQRRLLSEATLTYQKALEIARGMEAADSNTKSFKTFEPSIKKFTSRVPRSADRKTCYRCGRTGHTPTECKFKDADCHSCGKKGHIAPVCKSSSQRKAPKTQERGARDRRTFKKTNRIHSDKQATDTEGSSGEEYQLHHVGVRSSHPVEVQVTVNGKQLTMEVDTGAALSIISESTRKAVFPHEKLRPSNIVLKTYTEEQMQVTGTLNVHVQYGKQFKKLVLVVIAGDGPSLFGRNWLNHITLDWRNVFAVRATRLGALDTLMHRHQELFSEGLGTVKPYKATLQVQSGAKPRFFKPRPVPFAIKDAIGKELDRLEQQGILKKVNSSDWAAPIVAVPKKDGKFRICGDYKVTVNQVLDVEQYPLPKPEDLFATLAGGKFFSKLDLSQAYLQLLLDDTSLPYVTVNTHQGLYTCTRLPFGVASAPAIFQRMMDTVLQGIPGVICYIDDILVSGKDEAAHLQSLDEVFTCLEKHGFRLKLEKCEFLLPKVEYLGHQISSDGIQPLPSKVTAIIEAPTPKNLQQLRSFLGLINYYAKFIPNLATILQPLNSLLQAGKKWNWSVECAQALQEAKSQITSARVLTHYDPTLPIKLASDASAYGVGAVISHIMPDGTERPIAFASRTLHASERNYAQLEKEALSIVFGVRRFHQYLYGRKFTLLTDHQPLTTILSPKKGIPPLAAARLQRWALLLSAYDYVICYKSTREHSNADGLSRLPLPADPSSLPKDGVTVFNVGQVQALPVTFQHIQTATRRDPAMSKVINYVLKGWPTKVPEIVQPYAYRQAELTIENGCLFWGTRVIIPKSLQGSLLRSLHETHPGITRMKALARSYFWWSGLDKDIEDLGKSCTACQAIKSNPTAAPLHPWVWPDTPWTRIHVDYAGPFRGKMFLVVVDAHSKWPEVIMMTSSTAQQTIEALRSLFSRYGLPEQLVSDNGTQFTSAEFTHFLKANRIKHIRSAPYHPSSNGLAERFVRTFKRSLKASEGDSKSLQHRLVEFLFNYRSTAHATTNVSPSELFLKRQLRTRFDLLKPHTRGFVESKQAEQKRHHDKHVKLRCFFPGSSVMVRNYSDKDKWIPGTVLKKLGPITYHVDVGNGRVLKRHIDQLLQCPEYSQPPTLSETSSVNSPIADNFSYPDDQDTTATRPNHESVKVDERRYPQRDRRPPDRFMPIS